MSSAVVVNLLFSLYLVGLVSFLCFVHPLYCCLVLVFNALVCCGLLMFVMGFSWYVLLFGLVYVGGVYVLFIFVSVCSPNSGLTVKSDWVPLLALLFFCFFGGLEVEFSFGAMVQEHSDLLCSVFEGYMYCFFCVLLLLSLVFVSLVFNVKESFYR